MRRSRGGTWDPDRPSAPSPLENHNAVGCHRNTDMDHQSPPAKRHLNGVSLAGQWWPRLSLSTAPFSPL